MKQAGCLVVLFGLAAAAASKAHLYNQKTGEVLEAKFTGKWFGGGHGKIEFVSATGEKITGEWSGIRAGDYAWGSIYNAGSVTTGSASRHSTVMRGRAVAAGNGRYFRCEFTSGASGHGTGACKDNRDEFYDLMF